MKNLKNSTKMIDKISPCVGICELNPSEICVGCLRTKDEISIWKKIDNEQKKSIYKNIKNKRDHFTGKLIIKDQLKRKITIRYPINKIVSLVPSITQTLYDFGLESKVIGITKFCPQGDEEKYKKICIGGTKNINIDKITQIDPDIILSDQEETPERIVKKISLHMPIWLSRVTNMEYNIEFMYNLNEILPCTNKIYKHLMSIEDKIKSIKQIGKNSSFLCLIWKDPYMAAASSTYISSFISNFGFNNSISHLKRYPKISLEEIKTMAPEWIFLPDEPYAFNEENKKTLQKILPKSKVITLIGKHLSWYGSLSYTAIDYFTSLCTNAISTNSILHQPKKTHPDH